MLGFDFSHALGAHHGFTPDDRRVQLVVNVATLLGYHATMLAARAGQTVGKRLLGIRVVTEGGEPLTFARAVWREPGMRGLFFGGYITLLWPSAAGVAFFLVLVDVVSPLLQADNRAVHDLLAGTRVVMAEGPLPRA